MESLEQEESKRRGQPEKEPGSWKTHRISGEHPVVGMVPHSSAFGLALPAAALLYLESSTPLLPHLLGNCPSSLTEGTGETELLLPPLTELEGPVPGALQTLHPTPTPWEAWRGPGMGLASSLGWREPRLQL